MLSEIKIKKKGGVSLKVGGKEKVINREHNFGLTTRKEHFLYLVAFSWGVSGG